MNIFFVHWRVRIKKLINIKSEISITFCFEMYFLGQNRLKTQIELWSALIEILAHPATYILIYNDFD